MKLFLLLTALAFSAHSATLVTDSYSGIDNIDINGQSWNACFEHVIKNGTRSCYHTFQTHL
ncbi:MAG: hypothetical protein V3V18_11590 [Methylococcales bacterium]